MSRLNKELESLEKCQIVERESNEGITDWPERALTQGDKEVLESSTGIVEHESGRVIIDPEDNKRWALCWVRLP